MDGFKDADSHDTVTVTEITLNGEDVMAHLNRVSATQFSLVLRDLAVDSYKVAYVAEDEAGNEMDDGEFSFEVNERQPYEIEVQPGWNLISLPATPVEAAIGDVLANNQYISPVLGYQQGDWVTAIREEDGTWRGRLETIDGGYGYWLHARTFESIETMLTEVDPAGTLPTVQVTAAGTCSAYWTSSRTTWATRQARRTQRATSLLPTTRLTTTSAASRGRLHTPTTPGTACGSRPRQRWMRRTRS